MSGASLVLRGGKVLTVNGSFDIVQAVAVSSERILAVGTDAEIAPLIGPNTRVIDLDGRVAMPGLVDAHAHMDREGLKEALPSMAGLRDIDDIVSRVADLARHASPGEWIITMPLGDPPEFGIGPDEISQRRWPTRHDLDRAAPNNPVYIKPAWGYWRPTLPLVSIANTRALEVAGITRNSNPPSETVVIDLDASGEPTGIFYDNNRMPVVEFTLMRKVPTFDLATRVRALPRSMQVYNSFGTTSVYEGHGAAADVIEAYKQVRAAQDATVRATLAFSPVWPDDGATSVAEVIADWARWLSRAGLGDEWLRLNGIYTEVETSPEHFLRKAVYPETGWAGFNYAGLPHQAVKELLIACARNGIRVNAIAGSMLDMFDEVAKVAPIAEQRWVLAHITALSERKIAQLQEHGVVATTHTNGYIWKSGAQFRDSLGPGRENEVVPLRRLLDAGVPVALGTDNVPVSLWYPVWQSVARLDRRTQQSVAPEQALTREEALRCVTTGGAYLTFEENIKGSLEPGKLADIVVTSQDPLTCDLEKLRQTKADLTIVGGRVVFDRATGNA